MISIKRTIAIVALASLALTGCKKSSGDTIPTNPGDYISKFSVSGNDVNFNFATVFASKIEMDLQQTFPVGNYGSVGFFYDANKMYNLTFQASYDLYKDTSLVAQTSLPNGSDFPGIVSGPLYMYKVKESSGYSVFAYVDQLAGTNGKRLAGIAIQLDNLKNNFPQISLTESFYKGNDRYGCFSIYGPRTVNGVTLPGGIFLVADTKMIVAPQTEFKTSGFKIEGPEASNYMSSKSKQKLMKQVRDALFDSGIRIELE